MSRYIDADAMKEWIDEYVSVFKKSDNKDIKGYIEHQPTIEPKCGEWIPCSERLPRGYSDDERVLATTSVDNLGVIIMPIYDVVSWYRKGYISAWMPLPEPYRERAGE